MPTPTDTKRPSDAEPGAAPLPRVGLAGLLDGLFTSVRLTLWLLGVLIIAIAIATVMPQNEPREAYLRAFGTVFGGGLHWLFSNVYGSWWFIAGFGLLAVNLVACGLRRTRRLLRAGAGPVTRAQVRARAHQLRWYLAGDREQEAQALRAALTRHGWRVMATAGEDGGLGLVARRGRLAPWAPTLVHAGMVIVLLGAAWGRFPGLDLGPVHLAANTYREMAPLAVDGVFPVRAAGNDFGLRLRAAGSARNAHGMPTDYWAKVDVLEGGEVVKSALVKPNRPLLYHSISVTLSSITAGDWQIEVTRGAAVGRVPIPISEDGQVDMMASVTRLDDPPWVAFVHELGTDAQGRPQAKVFVDESGELSQNWQAVGWVGTEAVEYRGVRFRLAQARTGAVLSLDRDVGIPVVYLGFAVMVLGSLLVLGASRHTLSALIGGKGPGSRVLIGISRTRTGPSALKLLEPVQAELGAVVEEESSQEETR